MVWIKVDASVDAMNPNGSVNMIAGGRLIASAPCDLRDSDVNTKPIMPGSGALPWSWSVTCWCGPRLAPPPRLFRPGSCPLSPPLSSTHDTPKSSTRCSFRANKWCSQVQLGTNCDPEY